MNWSIFQSMFDGIEQPILDKVNGISDLLLGAVSGPLHAALIIYIALIGVMIVSGKMNEPLRDTWGRIARGAAIAGFLTAGTYNQYIRDFFLNGLPNDLLSAVTGGSGSVSAASFDHVMNKAFGGGLAVWKNLAWTDFGLQILVIVYWFAGAVATGFGFLVWMASHIVLGLYVAVGPILLATFLFPATRSLAERWLGSMITMVLLQLFVVSLLVVLTGAETTLLANIATAGGGGNPIAQIQVLIGAIVLFVICGVVVVQMPGAASAIAGGMYLHANTMARATFGSAMQVGGRAFGAARSVAAAQGATAQRRLTAGHTPGPSLSSSGTRP